MKRWFIPLHLIWLLLVSCRAQTPNSTTATAIKYTPTASLAATREITQASNAPPGCTVISPLPTPGPTQQSLFPPISSQDWVSGPMDATVTLLEYSDFQ